MWKHVAFVCVVAVVVMYLLWPPSSQLHTLEDKRVLVTGASSGIGEQIAYVYARYGASVVVTARRQIELTKVTDKCATLSPSQKAKFFAVPADMSNPNEYKRVIQESIKLMGGLDILVLNHVSALKFVKYKGTQKSLDDLDYDMTVNFKSYAHLATHALDQLKANNGSIIVLNSIIGKVPIPGMLSYSASKHALNGFFHSLSNDIKTFGGNVSITVCSVGFTGTEAAINMMKKHVEDFNVESGQNPEVTAYDVVEAGARRVDRMFSQFFPDKLITFLHAIWPTPIEKLFNSMMASMKNVDS